jgi:hypothetical protein
MHDRSAPERVRCRRPSGWNLTKENDMTTTTIHDVSGYLPDYTVVETGSSDPVGSVKQAVFSQDTVGDLHVQRWAFAFDEGMIYSEVNVTSHTGGYGIERSVTARLIGEDDRAFVNVKAEAERPRRDNPLIRDISRVHVFLSIEEARTLRDELAAMDLGS